MSNFKHGKPRHQRAGCGHCKPHKKHGQNSLSKNNAQKIQRKIPVPDTFSPITVQRGDRCPVCTASEEHCTCGNVVWL